MRLRKPSWGLGIGFYLASASIPVGVLPPVGDPTVADQNVFFGALNTGPYDSTRPKLNSGLETDVLSATRVSASGPSPVVSGGRLGFASLPPEGTVYEVTHNYGTSNVTVAYLPNTFTAYTDQDVLDIAPSFRTQAELGDVRLLLRAGASIAGSSMDELRGGSGRQRPLVLGGTAIIEGERVNGSIAVDVESFLIRDTDGPSGGYELRYLNWTSVGVSRVSYTGDANIDLTVRGCSNYGSTAFDPTFDYHATFAVTGLTGTPQVGEFMVSSGAPDAGISHQLVFRGFASDGRMIVDNGTSGGRTPSNGQAAFNNGDTVTFQTSGATLTLAGDVFDPLPSTEQFINIQRPVRNFYMYDCDMSDTDSTGIEIRAEISALVDGLRFERFNGDAIKYVPNNSSNATRNADITFRNCDISRPIALGTYWGNPHADYFQIQNGTSDFFAVPNILFEFVRLLDGRVFAPSQHIFIKHPTNGNITLRACILAMNDSVHAVTAPYESLLQCRCENVSVIPTGPGLVRQGLQRRLRVSGQEGRIVNTASEWLVYDARGNNVVVQDSFADQINGIDTGDTRETLWAGLGGDNPFWPDSFEDLMIMAAPHPSKPSTLGGAGSNVDWVNRTIDETGFPAIPVPDATAPTYTNEAVDVAGTTIAIPRFDTSDRGGTATFILSPTDEIPLDTQIEAFTDANDNPVPYATALPDQPGTVSAVITGLVPGQTYYPFFVHRNNKGLASVGACPGFVMPSTATDLAPALAFDDDTGFENYSASTWAFSGGQLLVSDGRFNSLTLSDVARPDVTGLSQVFFTYNVSTVTSGGTLRLRWSLLDAAGEEVVAGRTDTIISAPGTYIVPVDVPAGAVSATWQVDFITTGADMVLDDAFVFAPVAAPAVPSGPQSFALNAGTAFADPSNPPSGSSLVEFEMTWTPSAAASGEYLFVQTSAFRAVFPDADDISLVAETTAGATDIIVREALLTPVTPGVQRTDRLVVNMAGDAARPNGYLEFYTNGILEISAEFSVPSGDMLQANRRVVVGDAAHTAPSPDLPAGTQIERLWIQYRDPAGTVWGTKEISLAALGSIAAINADPWLVAGSVTAA